MRAAAAYTQLPIHRSLIRPILLGGGERDLVILNMTLACALIFGVGINIYTTFCTVVLVCIVQKVLVRLAKLDPMMTKVYRRHIAYRDFYPAKSSHLAGIPPVKPSMNP